LPRPADHDGGGTRRLVHDPGRAPHGAVRHPRVGHRADGLPVGRPRADQLPGLRATPPAIMRGDIHDGRSRPMSRDIQVPFDAPDPQALSSFWRDALGYVHPGPPGVELPPGADPAAAWADFLDRAGVPEDERNARSAVEDPDGDGPRLFFQQVPEGKVTK